MTLERRDQYQMSVQAGFNCCLIINNHRNRRTLLFESCNVKEGTLQNNFTNFEMSNENHVYHMIILTLRTIQVCYTYHFTPGKH